MRLTDLWHDLEHIVVHVVLGRPRGGGPIRYEREGLRYRTRGLRAALSHPELEIEVSEERLMMPALRFLNFVVGYVSRSGARINESETLLYGFWLVKFVRARDGELEAWDLVPETTDEFQPKADLAMRFAAEQMDTATRLHADFDAPSASTHFAADAGVLEGRRIVELVRDVPVNPQHSGWFIVSDAYGGDVDELSNEHLYRLAARRPEVVRYLGLVPGWHVDLTGEERAWLEKPASDA